MSATMQRGTVAVESAKVGPVAKRFAVRIGMTEGSAHQVMQRMRRYLPLLVRAAREAGKADWVNWFFLELDTERLKCEVRPIREIYRIVGADDRSEDAAREAYMLDPTPENALAWDRRLEHQMMRTAEARHSLRRDHPALAIQ